MLWFNRPVRFGEIHPSRRTGAGDTSAGVSTYPLNSYNVHHALCRNLGFGVDYRHGNICRMGAVARLMVDSGLIVLIAFISFYHFKRQLVRDMLLASRFIEVFVDTPLAVCEARVPQKLYQAARASELRNFTGIDAVYEALQRPYLHLDGEQLVTNLTGRLLDMLDDRVIIGPECAACERETFAGDYQPETVLDADVTEIKRASLSNSALLLTVRIAAG